MLNSIPVGLGEIHISREPKDVLVAYGLGSCLGISMYDPDKHIAGMLHALLPLHPHGTHDQSPRYVDSGIVTLLAEMIRAGANRNRIVVRMAGGANMLAEPGDGQSSNSRSRNVEAALATFDALNLTLNSQEVGGKSGRTVRLYVQDGRMTVRTMGNQEREI